MRQLKYFLAAMLMVPSVAIPSVAMAHVAGDGVISVDSDNSEMNRAKDRARKELTEFYARMKSPKAQDEGFVIKFNLDPKLERAEFIWAGNLEWVDGQLFGTLNNVPQNPNFQQDQRVMIPQRDIIDWSFWDGKTVQGEYTTRVLLPMMDAETRAQVIKNNGW